MATTLNISLPRALKDYVEAEVARGGYGSASEFIREVLRESIARRSAEDLERRLLEGLASPAGVMEKGDWEDLREAVRKVARVRRR